MNAFNNIIGYESEKNELYQIIDMIKNKEMYEKMGARLPKGVLIHGQPGMGKSMIVEALVKECGVKSFLLKKNKDEKSTIDEITNTFAEASKEDISIIVIDDIDKFSERGDENEDDQAFVAIQSGIDSVKDRNVLVVATANNYRKLPESLRRSGRFDRHIALLPPDRDDARKIIEHYMKNKCVDPNLDYEDVSKMISYTSCAALEKILNESAIYAASQRKENIGIEDITKAYLRDQYNVPVDEFEDFKISNEEIESTAIHEAGHAVIAEVLKRGSIGLISVQPSGKSDADGFTKFCEGFKRRGENVLIALGGKAAVELFLQGRCGSGCQSDLSKAAGMLRSGITESGTCGIGLLDVSNGSFSSASERYSGDCESVTRAELERYLFVARDILIKNKDFLMKIVSELKNKKTLLYSDIKGIEDSIQITEVPVCF